MFLNLKMRRAVFGGNIGEKTYIGQIRISKIRTAHQRDSFLKVQKPIEVPIYSRPRSIYFCLNVLILVTQSLLSSTRMLGSRPFWFGTDAALAET
jgi:hypothetical protein